MQDRRRTAVRDHARAAGLTLAVHTLFALLLLLEKRFPPRPLPPSRQPAGMWIHLPLMQVALERPAALESSATPPRPIVVAQPEPVIATEAAEIPDSAPPVDVLPGSRIDWHGEAARLAAGGAGEPEVPATFGKPRQGMRQPCEPRDSSFDWSPEVPKAGLLPLPYVTIDERCLVTVGFFSCVLGPLPPPNKHLFDDMQAGRTPDSSVPDPNVCD